MGEKLFGGYYPACFPYGSNNLCCTRSLRSVYLSGLRHHVKSDLASPAAKEINSQEEPLSVSDGATAGDVVVYSGLRPYGYYLLC